MRTEQDVLKDFEKLGWEVADGYVNFTLRKKLDDIKNEFMYYWLCYISINKENKTYSVYKLSSFSTKGYDLTMQEHKLLNELFTIWGWI
jgi:hypothetical protein